MVLRNNVLANWDSYLEAQCQYKKAERRVNVESWRRFYESMDKTPDLYGLRKILAKDKGAMEKPLKFSPGNISRVPKETLSTLQKKKDALKWDLRGPISSGYLAHCSHPFFTSICIMFSMSYIYAISES